MLTKLYTSIGEKDSMRFLEGIYGGEGNYIQKVFETEPRVPIHGGIALEVDIQNTNLDITAFKSSGESYTVPLNQLRKATIRTLSDEEIVSFIRSKLKTIKEGEFKTLEEKLIKDIENGCKVSKHYKAALDLEGVEIPTAKQREWKISNGTTWTINPERREDVGGHIIIDADNPRPAHSFGEGPGWISVVGVKRNNEDVNLLVQYPKDALAIAKALILATKQMCESSVEFYDKVSSPNNFWHSPAEFEVRGFLTSLIKELEEIPNSNLP